MSFKKCKWCGKSIKGGLLTSNYCSRKCEKEAEADIAKEGSGSSGGFGIIKLIIIAAVIYFIVKGCDSETTQESNENKIENNSFEEDRIEDYSIQHPLTEEQPPTSKEEIRVIENHNKSRLKIVNKLRAQQTAIDLLISGKSISEVSNTTGLTERRVKHLNSKIKRVQKE